MRPRLGFEAVFLLPPAPEWWVVLQVCAIHTASISFDCVCTQP